MVTASHHDYHMVTAPYLEKVTALYSDSANPQRGGNQVLPILRGEALRFCQSSEGRHPDSANPQRGGTQILPILGVGAPRF